MSHVKEHCGLPRITRHWKRLGVGALWMCSCRSTYRLSQYSSYATDGTLAWRWERVATQKKTD